MKASKMYEYPSGLLGKVEDQFRGWEEYPSSLPGFDPLCEDGDLYSDRLEVMAMELFSLEDALQVIDLHGW
jgi:hypothetical protein